MNIYGNQAQYLPLILTDLEARLTELNHAQPTKLYEHLIGRVKAEDSMIEKCHRKNYPVNSHSALRKCKDAVALRLVCRFIEDVYTTVAVLKQLDWAQVVTEKDYIKNAKPNGYRSYHLILDVTTPYPDVEGQTPGHYFVEIQLRTIAMDSWASLEHELKYKQNIAHPERIAKELQRCAEELAACDLQMQTIRHLIHQDEEA